METIVCILFLQVQHYFRKQIIPWLM
jgi:hypothetical protein